MFDARDESCFYSFIPKKRFATQRHKHYVDWYCFFVIFTSKIGDLYAKNTT